jgi:glycosyltransferase involved in cell wall biosynthesis
LSTTEAPDFAVVYFGNDWHAGNRTSSHHVAQRLAERLTVLYVDSPGMRAPTATGRDASRLWRKLRQTFQSASRVQQGLWHCTVPQLPWRGLPGVSMLNRWFGAWAVRRAMRRAGIRRAVLWFVVPHPAFMMDVVPHALSVYYCIDDYAAHPGVDPSHIGACDARLTRDADLVFVAPPALLESKRAQNPATRFSPHGVDVALFGRAQDATTVVPPPAAALRERGPVIGYFGLIAAWTDLELIGWLADQRPRWQFLLVGLAQVDVDALARRSNVTLVGPQPYESLPGWAKAFDVAIIPYRLNQQVRNANPLKLREYLATGKPVVSVDTPEIARFGEVVRIAADREAFLAAIEASLAEDSDLQRDGRMAAVAGMSWDHRVAETLSAVTDSLLSKSRA